MDDRIALCMIFVVLLIAAVTDWRTQKIPNWLTAPAILGGFAFWLIAGFVDGGLESGMAALGRSLLAFAAGLLPMWIILTLGGFGGGDVKLMGALGALSANVLFVLYAAFYSLIAAALMGLIVMVSLKRTRATVTNIVNAALARAAKSDESALPKDSPKLPFAVAALVGGILAGLEVMLEIDLPWSGLTG